jgi:hypothetical protein
MAQRVSTHARIALVARRCGRSRSKFSRLSFPADKATSQVSGNPSVFSTSFFDWPPVPHPSASRGEEQHVAQVHLLPGTHLPQRKLWSPSGSPVARNTNTAVECSGSKRLRRFGLQPREQAVHETRSPWRHCVLAFVFVSHRLLFTLSEVMHQNAAGERLRYPESKRSLIFCQALFFKSRVFGPFFA